MILSYCNIAGPIAAWPSVRTSSIDLPCTVRRMRIEMGTSLVIEARAPSRAEAARAVSAAFSAAAQVARCLDPAERCGDLARINAAAPGTSVPISAAALDVLRLAQRLNARSGGVFDPCLPTRPGRMADLELSEGEHPRATPQRALEIDCGGIAKGYVVDVAVTVLQAAGCSAGLVNAGGDVRAFGGICALLLRGPGASYRSVSLADAAVAVSDRDAPRAPSGHRGYYVRAGMAGARRYAAVRAPDAMTADALTKCLLLAPGAPPAALLAEFGAESLV